jgi:hypothetical protein
LTVDYDSTEKESNSEVTRGMLLCGMVRNRGLCRTDCDNADLTDTMYGIGDMAHTELTGM